MSSKNRILARNPILPTDNLTIKAVKARASLFIAECELEADPTNAAALEVIASMELAEIIAADRAARKARFDAMPKWLQRLQ